MELFNRIADRFLCGSGERGASMVEYSLLVVLIAIVAVVAVQLAGGQLSETYSEIGSELERVGS